ncbi:UNVERIFIED_CONTAM: hypothetical protein PYX00_001630 [Menopon gallinae]|uniref:Uncharacterized protein n=1 Tax=Menopon gallinae TaxID=328185 RepID=A0AAW2IDH7_9NEOP
MSDNADISIWSNDEIELLDTIDKDIKLVSSGSESESNQINQLNGELWKVFEKNESGGCTENSLVRQSELNTSHSEEFLNESSNTELDKLKSHFSSNDLSKLSVGKIPQSESVPDNVIKFSNSHSCNNILVSDTKRSVQHEYETVSVCEDDNGVMEDGELGKEYLQEINRRLAKELEEKNALLAKLQENYEKLLLKYAEAQNKIDQLRLKSVCESAECQTHSAYKQNFTRTNLQLPINLFPGKKEHQDAWEDVKCQKAVVAPFRKDDFQEKSDHVKVERPSSLPLDTGAKVMEMDNIKAGTPTDSEGVSSVITSMSGHSKILNTLDVHSPNSRDLKYAERDFILSENSVVNDAFDKVKNWQNSLPPLEQIETPETTLYDESPHSPSTNYHMLPSPKNNADELFSGRNQNSEPITKYKDDDDVSQTVFKEYLRTLSLPSAMKKNKNALRKRTNEKENPQNHSPTKDVPSSCIIQKRKRPPLLRCSSLPAYDCDSPKSTARKMYIPPLDLENLTLSDVDSSQVEYGEYDNGNRVTSSSYITSQSGSMEFSQTYRTMNNSFKGRLSDYSDYSLKPSFNKSTSITPERCNEMIFPKQSDPKNLCQVCGENVTDRDMLRNFPFRSSSYQSFQDVQESTPKTSERRGKHPFNRSVSFNSESRRCFHGQENCFVNRRSEDSLEKFDIYTNNLKARSQRVKT